MKEFDVNERLPLSALKQYIYCRRRFALMYIECEWGENYKIVEGDLLHLRVNDPCYNEKRKDLYISRSIPVFSDTLNLYGVADIVEFIKNEDGIRLPGKKGLWQINPVEYKNGKPEKSNADNYQLCAQALCLEEMFQTEIQSGDIFYGKIKRRVNVELNTIFKNQVKEELKKMNVLFVSQKVPEKPEAQNCSLCSLIDICMPSAFSNKKGARVQIKERLRGR